VEVAHLERNTLKYRDISTESVTSDREDGVPQLFKEYPSLTIVYDAFLVDVLPPEVLLLIGIAEEDDTPRGVIHALAEVCRIDDKMNRSWVVCLFWNDDRVNDWDECLSVVSRCIR